MKVTIYHHGIKVIGECGYCGQVITKDEKYCWVRDLSGKYKVCEKCLHKKNGGIK